MPRLTLIVSAVLALIISASLTAAPVRASGGIGYYGIIERVVFEPQEKDAERVQVWGAFAYVNLATATGTVTSRAERGYLYFRVRSDIDGFTSPKQIELNRREWADLKSVAATGQAVGFGSWGYIGSFDVLDPRSVAARPSFLFERKPSGGALADLRVRPADERPDNPATYQTEMGVTRISETGNHAAIVAQLREALKRR
jgi:hypothetical protein